MKKIIMSFIFLGIAKFSFCQEIKPSHSPDCSRLYIIAGIDLKKSVITAQNSGEKEPSEFKAMSEFISGVRSGDSLFIYGNDLKPKTTYVVKVVHKYTGKIVSGLVVKQ